MWYRSASDYAQHFEQERIFNDKLIEKCNEHKAFLEEAKTRNPDKLAEIEIEIAKMDDKIKLLSTPSFPSDPDGHNYLYHSTDSDHDSIAESGLDPDYGADNLHKTFEGPGYTFFSSAPQNGYGQNVYRVRRDQYDFRDDGGEYATNQLITPDTLQYWNGSEWTSFS